MRPFKENALTERSRWLPKELTVSRKNYFTEQCGWCLMAAQPPSFNQLHKPCKALGLSTGSPTFQTSCPSLPFLVLLVHFHVLVLALVFKVWLFLCSGSLLPTAPHHLPKSSWRLVVLENLKAGTGTVVSRLLANNFLSIYLWPQWSQGPLPYISYPLKPENWYFYGHRVWRLPSWLGYVFQSCFSYPSINIILRSFKTDFLFLSWWSH